MDDQNTLDQIAKPIILTKPEHPILNEDIDPDVYRILSRLHSQGFIAYLTGGAVRDMMLGKQPKDFDLVTDARPGQIKKRFANAYVIGRRFRLAHVHFKDGKVVEVSTFRKDPSAEDDLAPEPTPDPKSAYGTPAQDAFRRDITINALFYDPFMSSVIDYVGGLEDLAGRRVRVIGDPEARFIEDPVRIWRVLRHSARLGFDIEERTERAIWTHLGLLGSCPGARLYEELNKDLAYETRPVFQALLKYGVFKYILGKIGENYESDAGMFSRLDALLDIEDRAKAGGLWLSQDEMYTLVLWPWGEALLADGQGDPNLVLKNALLGAQMRVTIPRSLRAEIIQIMIMLRTMKRALRTGHIRWSLQKRSHYRQAAQLFFLIEKGRPAQAGESFESLFWEAFPAGAKWRRGRRRRS